LITIYPDCNVQNLESLMSDHRQKLGKWGESVAAVHLEAKGIRLVERNWRSDYGEIDIIAQDSSELVFVEVKTRRGNKMGTPEEALTREKAKKLRQLAQLYLAENESEQDWRIDLVAIEIDGTGKLLRCDHIRNAVLGW